jgi:peptidoglycan/xylan/chitin deacetylase (PgdA/CDA1 family)
VAVSRDDLSALASEPIINIGAHSMTHPVLSSVSVSEQRSEINDSKRSLEGFLSSRVDAFSYPFGGRADYSGSTVRLVREAGFALACANFPARVHWATRRYEIPRFIVRNWTGSEFAQQLDSFFDGS